MLEVEQQATVITTAVDENDDECDFLDLTAFANGATFATQCHYFECDNETSSDWRRPCEPKVPLSWRRPPYECQDDSDDDSSSDGIARRRVRFSLENDIRLYDKPTPQDWNRLYYSCHELQKIVDDYRLEQQEEKDFEEECSRLEAKQGHHVECSNNNEQTMHRQDSETNKGAILETISVECAQNQPERGVVASEV